VFRSFCYTLTDASQRDHFVRHDSSETSEWSASSGLTTPADEEMLHPFDLVAVQDECDDLRTPKLPNPEPFKHREGLLPKARTLSKAVMKAKQFAQTLARSNKLAKVWFSHSIKHDFAAD